MITSTNIAFQQEVLDKYNSRVTEIDLFYDLVGKIENVNPVKMISIEKNIGSITDVDFQIDEMYTSDKALRNILSKLETKPFDFEISNIFKSNAILLLYNLIESTVSYTDNFILNHISSCNLKLEEVIPEVKSFYLQHQSDFEKSKFLITALEILENMHTITIDVRKQVDSNSKEFQGNLNPREIDNLLQKYGIETTKQKMLTQENIRINFKNIVDWRNDLAHGKYSFAEFGRRLFYDNGNDNDILVLKDNCYELLKVLLKNVEEFILDEKYKILSV